MLTVEFYSLNNNMMALLFGGYRHVMNNVMITRVLTFFAGDDVHANNAFFVQIMSTLKAKKTDL